jgi:hypothetical protein
MQALAQVSHVVRSIFEIGSQIGFGLAAQLAVSRGAATGARRSACPGRTQASTNVWSIPLMVPNMHM